MNQFTPITRANRLSGAQKSAILFLCLGEERGGALMQKLDVGEIRRITNAISTMGEVQADVVEEIMAEFGGKVAEYGSITGSVAAARGLLNEFLPEERVAEILGEIESNSTGTVWSELSALDERTLVDIISPEHNQTIAVILTQISAGAAAKALPLLGVERAAELVQRMMQLNNLPKETLQNVEDSIRGEIRVKSGTNSAAMVERQIVSVFNKIGESEFQDLAKILDQQMPDQFRALKQKMFVFDDLTLLPPIMLSKVMREGLGTTLPLALRGAKKDVREAFLAVLPSRSRDMLTEEMASMGAIKTKEARAAQSELVEIAMRLSAEGEIALPDGDTEELIS